MPIAPVQHSKSSRPITPSLKHRLNKAKKSSATVRHSKNRPASIEIISDENAAETPIPTKVPLPTPVLCRYLLTAHTEVGIQTVYCQTESVVLGLWSAKQYFDESTIRVQKAANERGIEPVLQSSTATIYNKSMKPAEYLTCDVNDCKEWSTVEDVIEHLSQSLSKSIRVDLVVKFSANQPEKEIEDVEEIDAMENDTPKVRQVVCAHARLLTCRLLRWFY